MPEQMSEDEKWVRERAKDAHLSSNGRGKFWIGSCEVDGGMLSDVFCVRTREIRINAAWSDARQRIEAASAELDDSRPKAMHRGWYW